MIEIGRLNHAGHWNGSRQDQYDGLLTAQQIQAGARIVNPEPVLVDVLRNLPVSMLRPEFFVVCRRWPSLLGVQLALGQIAALSAIAPDPLLREMLLTIVDAGEFLVQEAFGTHAIIADIVNGLNHLAARGAGASDAAVPSIADLAVDIQKYIMKLR